MKYSLSQNTGAIVECITWADVLQNLTVYVSPGDKVQAKSMLDAGCTTWDFVYGFSHERVTKL